MEFRKRILLGALAVCASQAAFADIYGNSQSCLARSVSIPCRADAWEISLELFSAKATSNDEVFAADTGAFVFPFTTKRNFLSYENNPNSTRSYEIAGRLNFGMAADISLSYQHVDANQDTTVSSASGIDITLANMIMPDSLGNYTTNLTPNNVLLLEPPSQFSYLNVTTPVTAHYHNTFNEFNVELGQYIDIGEDADIRLHGGFAFTNLTAKKEVTWTKFDAITGLNVFEQLSGTSSLSMPGLTVGTNGVYHFGYGFSLAADVAVTSFFGNIDYTGYLNVSEPTGNTDQITMNANQQSVIVPAVKAQMGLGYDVVMGSSDLLLQLGYRTESLIGALRFGGANVNTENFTVSGPYLMVKYID